jgi:hypothetical protein
MGTPLNWRYRRDAQVLYVRADYELTDAEYVLHWHHPDDATRVMRLSTVTLVYDYLRAIETQLGADGWELLPANQRAPNRLHTPLCPTCPLDRHVETTKRSNTHVHFRCTGCGHVWVVPKPGASL